MQCYSAVSAVPLRDHVHVEMSHFKHWRRVWSQRKPMNTRCYFRFPVQSQEPSLAPFPSGHSWWTPCWPQLCTSTGLPKGTEHLPRQDGSQMQLTFTHKTAGAKDQPTGQNVGTLHTSQTPRAPKWAQCGGSSLLQELTEAVPLPEP